MDTYDDIREYIKEEEIEIENRKEMLEKALELAELKKTDDERTPMVAEDVVNAAKLFNDFIEKG